MSNQLREQYDRWHGELARTEGDPRELRLFNWILDLLNPRPGAQLLDVACGQGVFLAEAAKRELQVSGVDLSAVALETARQVVPSAVLRQGSGEALGWESDTFDYVTCVGSLEHFEDPAAGARELARVVRPEGKVLVYVPNLFFLGHVYFGLRHGRQPSEAGQGFSETFRSSEGWIQLLQEAGLTVRSWHAWNYIWASQKVSPRTMRLWNAAVRLIPKNGAYSFAFVCSPA